MTQDTDSRASEGASLCPNCVDDQKCRRKMVCDASGWPLRPISADAAQAQEPSEEQITAALSAAAFFDTPQSRKDMRRALIAAADPSRLPELLGLAPSATQATSEIACHPSTDGAPAEPTGEMRWAGAQEAQRQLRWKPYEMDWQRAAAAIYKAMLAAAPPPPAAMSRPNYDAAHAVVQKHGGYRNGLLPEMFAAASAPPAQGAAAPAAPAQPKRSDPKNCTARVNCDNGIITTRSCTTQRPLIDKGGSSDGERDYYECPDCGKSITIDYREN
jgi:hypothetical protein